MTSTNLVTSALLEHPTFLLAQRAALLAHGNGAQALINPYPEDASIPGVLLTTSSAREDFIDWHIREQHPEKADAVDALWAGRTGGRSVKHLRTHRTRYNTAAAHKSCIPKENTNDHEETTGRGHCTNKSTEMLSHKGSTEIPRAESCGSLCSFAQVNP